MNHTVIPAILQDILNKDKKWEAKTQTSINKMSEIIENSDMYFFPEYTNHSMEHIMSIFELIGRIAPVESLEKLSPKSVSFLILSVYLHDLGMYLKPDGLRHLLSQTPWKNEYDKYIKAAQRMSDIDLKKLYGDSAGFVIPPDLNDRLELSDRHKLTYGDFLRRNHGAIAEYIAINGMPGNTKMELFEDFDDEHKKIIGLIAKSHTLPIRAAAKESNKLMGKANLYRPSNVPIVYLMVLLRIGDILDIGKDRAPHIVYNMQRFSSPISKEEWEWNQTIDPSDFNWDTSKTLYIQSDPKNTMQFVKVEDNLKWFQTELDFSWAALCDCYGNEFNLIIHRIESNIFEQREEFNKKFLTKETKIRITSNLSKLLVNPLYDGNPVFAIRELLQNAVDACNLRKEIERKKGNYRYKGKILVHLDTVNNIFTIKDNGAGMNEDIITNYYLTVGANFRNSSYWNEKISDKVDEENVVRAGRFGIGFLAAFLIGDLIQVTTRHLDDGRGYVFNVALEEEQVDVQITNGLEYGTEIKIPAEINKLGSLPSINGTFLDGRIESKSLWNSWYHNEFPEICYMLDDEILYPKFNYNIPDNIEEDKSWIIIDSDIFKQVGYKFYNDFFEPLYSFLGEKHLVSDIIINGFYIQGCSFSNKEIWGFPNKIVVCSITDEKNLLNINLTRNNLNTRHKIFELINIDIWKRQLARMLCLDVPANIKNQGNAQTLHDYLFVKNLPDGILYYPDRYSFAHPCFIKKLHLRDFYMLQKPMSDQTLSKDIPSFILNDNLPFLLYSGLNFTKCFMELFGEYQFDIDHNGNLKQKNYIFYRKDEIDGLFECIHLNAAAFKYEEDFYELVEDVFSDVEDLWIPFDFEERKKKFKKAFQVLAKYTENGKMELIV